MKKNKFLLMITLMIFYQNISFGQCIANAGVDTALCEFNEIQLGGNPIVTGGQAPYSYKWYIEPLDYFGNKYYASDFLNDTTLSNPTLLELETDIYILEITDFNGQICKDTIRIYYPSWKITLDDKIREVSANTPVELYTSVHSENSLLTYLWTPSTGLSNPNIANPTAITEESITYNLLITDSAGCKATDVFDIFINDTKAKSINSNEIIKILETNEILIFETESFGNKTFELYEITGNRIKQIQFNSKQIILNKKDLHSGIYLYQILDNDNIIDIGKIKIN